MHHFEVHFDEAAFLWHQRAHALTSPRHTPEETMTIEARLRAHVDGAVLVASAADHRSLAAALEDDAPERIAAATLILADDEFQQHAPILERLKQGDLVSSAAICRALRTRFQPGLVPALRILLEVCAPAIQALLIEVLSDWGQTTPDLIERFAHQGPSSIRAACLRALLRQPSASFIPLVTNALTAPDAEVRNAAIISGLKLGQPVAWEACLQEASSTELSGGLARLLVAMGGEDAEHARLLNLLTSSKTAELRHQALWALGFSGRPAVVEACLPLLSSHVPYEARMAAEAISAITGLRLEGAVVRQEHAASPEEEQELEATILPPPEASLPVPHAEAIHAWWKAHREELSASGRYLNGQSCAPEPLLTALREGPMRRREPIALELMLRSQTAWAPTLGAYLDVQLRELGSLQPHASRARMHSFSKLVGTATPQPLEVNRPRLAHIETRTPRPPRNASVITALGMVSPLGLDVATSCAAARAGLSSAKELDGCETVDASDGTPQPIRGHPIPTLTQGFMGLGRLARLGEAALRSMRLQPGGATTRCGLFVALPSASDIRAYHAQLRDEEARDAEEDAYEEPPVAPLPSDNALTQHLLPLLTKLTGLRIAPEHQRCYPGDTLGFLHALREAIAALHEGRLERCIVGGIDSLVSPERLEALKHLGHIKVPLQPARMLPGEAAAFLLLERSQDAAGRGAQVLALCEGVHVQEAPASGWVSAANAGRALATSLSATLSHPAGQSPPGRIIGCLNGSDRRAYTWGHTLPMLAPQVRLTQLPLWSPAESFGELGAATGPVAVCMAVRDFARGAVDSPHAIVWLMDDQGGVGSFRVRSELRERLPTGARA